MVQIDGAGPGHAVLIGQHYFRGDLAGSRCDGRDRHFSTALILTENVDEEERAYTLYVYTI